MHPPVFFAFFLALSVGAPCLSFHGGAPTCNEKVIYLLCWWSWVFMSLITVGAWLV
jgi:hypothetical protein